VSGRARLILLINDQAYSVTLHECSWANPALSLTKPDGTRYEIANGECTCPDFVYCRDRIDPKGCKHVAALRAVGLLPKFQPHEDQ
jgi:hypothetical protein